MKFYIEDFKENGSRLIEAIESCINYIISHAKTRRQKIQIKNDIIVELTPNDMRQFGKDVVEVGVPFVKRMGLPNGLLYGNVLVNRNSATSESYIIFNNEKYGYDIIYDSKLYKEMLLKKLDAEINEIDEIISDF